MESSAAQAPYWARRFIFADHGSLAVC